MKQAWMTKTKHEEALAHEFPHYNRTRVTHALFPLNQLGLVPNEAGTCIALIWKWAYATCIISACSQFHDGTYITWTECLALQQYAHSALRSLACTLLNFNVLFYLIIHFYTYTNMLIHVSNGHAFTPMPHAPLAHAPEITSHWPNIEAFHRVPQSRAAQLAHSLNSKACSHCIQSSSQHMQHPEMPRLNGLQHRITLIAVVPRHHCSIDAHEVSQGVEKRLPLIQLDVRIVLLIGRGVDICSSTHTATGLVQEIQKHMQTQIMYLKQVSQNDHPPVWSKNVLGLKDAPQLWFGLSAASPKWNRSVQILMYLR